MSHLREFLSVAHFSSLTMENGIASYSLLKYEFVCIRIGECDGMAMRCRRLKRPTRTIAIMAGPGLTATDNNRSMEIALWPKPAILAEVEKVWTKHATSMIEF